MRYENKLFPVGHFLHTHRVWTNERYTTWDKIKCFFGHHAIEFFLAGNTEHCACCHYYHNVTFRQRLRYALDRRK